MRRCTQFLQKQLVFLTADHVFVQAARIQTIMNRSHQIIYCSNGKVSQYTLVCSKTEKFTGVSSGAEGKFRSTIFGRDGFARKKEVAIEEMKSEGKRPGSISGYDTA